jgi:hypothetical protein
MLVIPNFCRSLQPSPPLTDISIWVDASTSWGVAILSNSVWDVWELHPNWKTSSRHIGWLESLAIEFAVSIFALELLRGTNILICSDNEGVIGSFNKGRSSNFKMNSSIRHSENILDAFNMQSADFF